MAIKKVQIVPPGYTDILHPETDSTVVLMSDGSTLENKMNSKIVKGNGTIPITGWTTVTGDYVKRYAFAISGALATDTININIDKDALDVAQDAEICATSESYAGGVYIYAKTTPASAIPFSYVILR